jgi:hypothetical protein
MKLYSAGDKIKGICDGCESVVQATFAYRDVPFDDSSGVAENILVGVCDTCSAVMLVPPQSTPAIRRAHSSKELPLEVIVRGPEIEILDFAAYIIDPTATPKFRKSLLAYYLAKVGEDPRFAEKLLDNLRKSKRRNCESYPKKRMSFKVSSKFEVRMREIMSATGLKKTEVVSGVVYQIEKDLILSSRPKELKKLREFADIMAA